jgi:hypothetical protein
MVGIAGVGRASRAYCDDCRAWKQRSLAFFPPGSGTTILDLLGTGQLTGVSELNRLKADPHNRRYTAVAAEFCAPPANLPADVPAHLAVRCPVFLAVKEVKFGGGAGAGMMFDWSVGRMKARVELTRTEVGDLVPVFPRLATLAPPALAPAGEAVTMAAALPGEAPAAAPGKVPAGLWPQPPHLTAATPLASISDVPPRFAGKVMTRGMIVVGNLVTLAGLGLTFGSVGLAGWAALQGARLLDAHRGGSRAAIVAWSVTGLGILTALVSGYATLRNPSLWGNRYLRRRVCAELDLRLDRLVNPSDAGTVLVEVVPRANWGAMMLETATDVGFLQIDPRGRQVLFEGDKERWRVPAASILKVTAEPATAAQGSIGEVPYYMCVIFANTPTGVRELSFGSRATGWRLPKDHRERAARDFQRRILELLNSGEVVAPLIK